MLEAIAHDAYTNTCRCPLCKERIVRDSREYTLFCSNCGAHLHLRAFTKKEIDDAIFDREMDDYEN